MRFLCVLLCCFLFSAESLQMHVHNTGQGNSIFLKNGQNALIVDFGVHQSGKYFPKSRDFESFGRYRPISVFLNEVQNITVVITHNHYDHYSLLSILPNEISSKIKNIYASMYGAQVLEPFLGQIECISVDHVDQIPIENVLGQNVQVYPVLPSVWPITGKGSSVKRSEDPNDNSISLVIKYGNSKVLLTGDATGATLNAVQKVPNNIDILQNITCMLLPHHGSNLNGSFSWFYFIKSNVSANFSIPLLTIISSDPKECDHLPWAGVSKFKCNREGGVSKVPLHMISTEEKSEYIDEPVYLSADAQSGFFRVIFKENAMCSLYDGDPISYAPDLLRVPLSCNDSISPKELSIQWNSFDISQRKEQIKHILEGVGDFSTELPSYIEWISAQLLTLKDDDLFLLAIKNLNAFTKESVFQQSFSKTLLQYLKENKEKVSESLVMSCIVNFNSLFLNDLLNNFSGFLHSYFSTVPVSIRLVAECLKYHETLFRETGQCLGQLLLSKLQNNVSYQEWQLCMIIAAKNVRDKEFLSALVQCMPNQ